MPPTILSRGHGLPRCPAAPRHRCWPPWSGGRPRDARRMPDLGLQLQRNEVGLRSDPRPLPFSAVRFLISTLLLWVVLRIVEKPAKLPPGALRHLIILGVVGNTCYQLAFMLGLSRTTATNSALILSTVPTVVAVLAGVLGLERITTRMRWGIALGTLGVILVIATRGVRFDIRTLGGDGLTVLAVFFWAGYTVGLRRMHPGVSPLRVTTITTIAGTPGLVLAGLPGMVRIDWGRVGLERVACPRLCLGSVVGRGVPALEPEREGGRWNPYCRLHVSDPTRGRVRRLAASGRAAPSAAGRGCGVHHRRRAAHAVGEGGENDQHDCGFPTSSAPG